MENVGTDFHLLTAIGAGCFAMSFIKGRAGHLLPSIWMALLAAILGITGAAGGGVLGGPGRDPLLAILAYLALPLAGVLVSRRLFLAGEDGDRP